MRLVSRLQLSSFGSYSSIVHLASMARIWPVFIAILVTTACLCPGVKAGRGYGKGIGYKPGRGSSPRLPRVTTARPFSHAQQSRYATSTTPPRVALTTASPVRPFSGNSPAARPAASGSSSSSTGVPVPPARPSQGPPPALIPELLPQSPTSPTAGLPSRLNFNHAAPAPPLVLLERPLRWEPKLPDEYGQAPALPGGPPNVPAPPRQGPPVRSYPPHRRPFNVPTPPRQDSPLNYDRREYIRPQMGRSMNDHWQLRVNNEGMDPRRARGLVMPDHFANSIYGDSDPRVVAPYPARPAAPKRPNPWASEAGSAQVAVPVERQGFSYSIVPALGQSTAGRFTDIMLTHSASGVNIRTTTEDRNRNSRFITFMEKFAE